MRKQIIAGNWKMNGSRQMAEELLSELIGQVAGLRPEVIVCPPYPYLGLVSDLVSNTDVDLGAQDASEHASGAHTGEVASSMLADMGCKYVIVGHSERRSLYGDSDDRVKLKFKSVQAQGMTPILCVGETLEERQQEETDRVVCAQLNAVLDEVGIDGFANAIIAYEPVWAIGTGLSATPEQAQAVHALLRNELALVSQRQAVQVSILYGGSVKPENARELFAMPDIDGALVGGASLSAQDFLGICRAF